MAISYTANRAAATGTGASGSTLTFSPTSNTTAGSLVVGAVALVPTAARTLNSVSDNSGFGNAWQVDTQQQNGTGQLVAVFSCVLLGSVSTSGVITLTFSGAATFKYAIRLEEFAGVLTSGWLDTGITATGTGSTTALTAGTTGAAAAGDLGIAMWGINAAAGAGLTPDGAHTAFSVAASQVNQCTVGEYNVSVSGAQSATGTAATAGTWAGVQACYKAAPAGSVTPTRMLLGVGT